jgi:hypothetical protein
MHYLGFMMACVLTAASAFAELPSIVPFDQVEPGMSGYGLTVFDGMEPSRFPFTVDARIVNFRGYRHIIQVSVSGEPVVSERDGLLSGTGVLEGMSGSPLYLTDGRLMGVLIMSYGGQRNAAYAYVVSVEDVLAMRDIAPAAPGPLLTTLVPGSSVAMCWIWGDFEECGVSTVSFDDGGYVFITGHEISDFAIGPLRIPVFRVPIVGLMATFQESSKIPGTIGEPVGAFVYNGWHGGLVRTDASVAGIPVSVTVRGLGTKSITRTARLASGKFGSALAREVFQFLATLGIDDDFRMVTTIAYGSKIDRRVDAPGAALTGFVKDLNHLLSAGKDADTIDIAVFPVPHP